MNSYYEIEFVDFFWFVAFVLTVFLKVSDPTSGHAVTLQGTTDPPGLNTTLRIHLLNIRH